MLKYIMIILSVILFNTEIISQPKFSQISVKPGAFSRMGFGARGIALGNGLSSLTEGNLVAYYNPALSVFQIGNSFQTSYSFLTFNRYLNFLSFTKRFELRSPENLDNFDRTAPIVGLSLGIINSGVSKIDGRDNNGLKTKEISTSENMFFIGLANKFSDKLVVGLTIKFYYYKLYDKISTTALGLDIGALYKFNENLNLSFVINDLNSKYKWDSSPIYNQNGLQTIDYFPILKKIGFRYKFPNKKLLIVAEYENSNAGTNIIKAGSEYMIYEGFFIRAGLDQLNLNNSHWFIKPAAGFSYSHTIESYILQVDYAYMLEPNSSSERHIIGINFNF